MRTFRDPHHPKFMYHATKPPVQVFSQKDIDVLGPEWSETYIYQEYPKLVYHLNGTSKTVHSREEENSLRGGWGTSQEVEFYNDPKRARQQPADSTRWVSESRLVRLPGITAESLCAAVLKADALFWRNPDPATAVAAMQLTFRGVAQVLFDTGALTKSVLESDLPVFVWDCAIAGGWWHLASNKPSNFCPDQIGHYWVWRDESRDWKLLFRSETSDFTASLLQRNPSPRSMSRRAAATKRHPKYVSIDAALREAAKSAPKSHEEVFEALEGRCKTPNAEPFQSAKGWVPGFRKDPNAARGWLSKRWTLLGLPPFPRGPK